MEGIASSGRTVQFGDGVARIWEKSCTAKLPCNQHLVVVISSEVVATTHGQLIAQPIKGAWIFSEPNTLAVLNNWVRRY